MSSSRHSELILPPFFGGATAAAAEGARNSESRLLADHDPASAAQPAPMFRSKVVSRLAQRSLARSASSSVQLQVRDNHSHALTDAEELTPRPLHSPTGHTSLPLIRIHQRRPMSSSFSSSSPRACCRPTLDRRSSSPEDTDQRSGTLRTESTSTSRPVLPSTPSVTPTRR